MVDASDHTIRSIYSNLAGFNEWANDTNIDPARANEDDLRAYRKHLVDSSYARGTIGVKLAAVRRLYEAAVWRGLRSDNPAAGLRAPRDETDQADKVKFLSLEGLKCLLTTPDPATAKGLRDRAILTLMGRHGLRVAEVAGLTVEAISEDTPPILTVIGKRRKRRTVHMTENTAAPLWAWLERCAADSGFVFCSLGNRSYGQPMTTRAIRHMVDGYLEKCGLKAEGVSCHSLRHSYATWSYFGGAKKEAIQGALGHASSNTTDVYVKIVDRIKENPANYLDSLLSDVI